MLSEKVVCEDGVQNYPFKNLLLDTRMYPLECIYVCVYMYVKHLYGTWFKNEIWSLIDQIKEKSRCLLFTW